ncbi:cell division control protein 6 homolog [Paramacrobiotus metropolitanus]|uniref:cell division control protein 6 homolog n=1 Tax=Paramacrobiotus metropolitanus TaxID=2943436 RepID=UPI00244591BE|nr:cell division control protein 6 homolog [Paramacrobiotus metropolitanus]
MENPGVRKLRSRVIYSHQEKLDSPEIPFKPALPSTPKKPVTPLKISAAETTAASAPLTPLSVKRTLSTQQVTPIKGRDSEMSRIKRFISDHLAQKTPGALYVSGKPGTGKTACINEIFSEHKGLKYSINCMGIDNPKGVYHELLVEMNQPTKGKSPAKSPRKHLDSVAQLKRVLTDNKRPMRLVLLDEIDQLKTKDLDVFRQIFLWPTLPNSRIILIGISNVLDFVSSLIRKLDFPAGFTPDVLHFAPYTVGQIKSILSDRMDEAVDKDSLNFDKGALELCARKVAATTGDIRTALSACRRGINMAENQFKKMRLNSDLPDLPNELIKSSPSVIEVKSSHIQMVMTEQSSASDVGVLPLQQRILICCAILLLRGRKCLTLGLLTVQYKKICPTYGLPELTPANVADLCEVLAANGVFSIKRGSRLWDSKVILILSEEDAEFHFAGKALLGAILNSSIC